MQVEVWGLLLLVGSEDEWFGWAACGRLIGCAGRGMGAVTLGGQLSRVGLMGSLWQVDGVCRKTCGSCCPWWAIKRSGFDGQLVAD